MKKTVAAIILTALTALTVTACSGSKKLPQENTQNTSDTSQTEKTAETKESTDNETEEKPMVTPDMSSYGVVPIDTKINYEFTEEDEELHMILEELDEAWSVFVNAVNNGDEYADYENSISVNFIQINNTYAMAYYPLSDELPFSDIESMKAELRKCFTEDTAEAFEPYLRLVKGEVVSETDGVYTLDMVSYESMPTNDKGEVVYVYPRILEVDGRLYRSSDAYGTHLKGIDYYTTRILSRTEDQIDFAFITPYSYDEIFTAQGRLRYEDGWKYDWLLFYPDELGVLNFYEVWGR